MKVLFIVPFRFIGMCNSVHSHPLHMFSPGAQRLPWDSPDLLHLHDTVKQCSSLDWMIVNSTLSCPPEILLVPQWLQSEASAPSSVTETHPPLNSMGWWLLQSNTSPEFSKVPLVQHPIIQLLRSKCWLFTVWRATMLMMWYFWWFSQALRVSISNPQIVSICSG